VLVPPLAVGLLLLAAAMHAGWNLLVKQARERLIFTWCALLVGALCFTPLLAFGAALPARAWPFIIASAAMEAAYYFALTRAYGLGDFSLVYPLARGTAPALLAVWATLFLGERLRPAGLLGLAVLIGGLLVVGGGVWWSRRGQVQVGPSGVAAALLVALCISIYSAIDGAAVQTISPIPYTVLILGLSAVFCAPAILLQYRRSAIVAEWRVNWPRIVTVGVLNLATYMLVLIAYSRAQVAYAGAVREISVVFAALVGWRWLGESFGAYRTVGALLIFAGIVIIAVFG
jgi:drug/metabolite transporter (DMT)-like permease